MRIPFPTLVGLSIAALLGLALAGCAEEAPPPKMPTTVYIPWLVKHKKPRAAESVDAGVAEPKAAASDETAAPVSAAEGIADAGG